ncbi:hypothetical protein HHS34_007015 [Acidithiobacillus montserratensis]|uniref:Uncharacterized protein n=1 Tax=Acidithiobacillus montserratensis TaxID=2729135 RepID=A0ACD5HJJ7_9PROT|nr:hypothetical protein [Acidithiobacillus montserratensis]MBN2679587.1 hypothetical protein [Acidithiobacillaceae bacterium]MBU2749306.1 hypothetical protein [Acidithiobacillus montserratensis]
MNIERIQGKVKRPKPRLGVHPTRIEKDRTIYNRKVKHRGQQRVQGEGHTVTMAGRQRMPFSMHPEIAHGHIA